MADDRTWREKLDGRNDLIDLHFGIPGGMIRVYGENLPANGHFAIGSYVYPIGTLDNAKIERHIPVGSYEIPISLWDENNQGIGEASLEATIDKDYFFMIALADITLGQNGVSGSAELLADDDHFDGSTFVDGRFAYYFKRKNKG